MMKKLQCELCGSIDIFKIDADVFQCQYCGCKYSTEQVKSMILEGEVRVKATDFEIVGGKLKKYNGASPHVVIPNSVKIIGSAFDGCSGVESIFIPNTVTTIEACAFRNCKSLSSIELPDSVQEIGDWAFENCVSLNSISIPDSVKSIGHFAFDDCESLKSLNIPDSVTDIAVSGVNHCIRFFSVPSSCKRLDLHLSSWDRLEKVIIPDSVPQSAIWGLWLNKDIQEIKCSKEVEDYLCKQYDPFLEDLLKRIRTGDPIQVSKEGYPFYEMPNLILQMVFERITDAERQRAKLYKSQNRCEFCGSEFYGVFKKKCVRCQRIKSY